MPPEEQAVDPAARRRRWKRIRTSVTLLVLVGFVVGAAWYSWNNVIDQSEQVAAPTSGKTCAPGAPADPPAPADIQVNIYNSTSRAGLAASIGDKMRDRGFVVVDVDNDPLDKTIEHTAEVRSNTAHQPAAMVVAATVPGAVFVPDDRTEATVDLVLGQAFKAMAKPGAPLATPSGVPPCEPVTG
jgi:hypothetical protein